ncbi:MAG TPA: hypothetical protein VFH68_16970 [Polyangia bacterium]|nr:hypothetical protein [Polyangia bacterium]
MIAQTAVFVGVSPLDLYDAFVTPSLHSAMTADGARPAVVLRGNDDAHVQRAEPGDRLRAVGIRRADGDFNFAVEADVLRAVPGEQLVLVWKNIAWRLAIDPREVTPAPSIVVLGFHRNLAGAEIRLVQVEVPDYRVRLPLIIDELGDIERAERAAQHLAPGGEVGPLREIVNTHWSLVYWEPMKQFFAARAR